MMNHGCILVLNTVKEEAKDTLAVVQGKRNAHIVSSSMQNARTTLGQPLVMADHPSFSVLMRTSR